MVTLKRVFEPIQIGNVVVPNRVVRTAHDTGFAVPDIGEDFIAYHVARAKGGCGLTILEGASVHSSSRLHLALFNDAIVPGFRQLMDAVRPYGMRVFQQLWHGGNLYPAFDGGPPFAVSDVPGYWGLVGRVMSLADIEEVKQAFVQAAIKCKEGGLDGVEVHACHGYLFHQFLAPCYNNRVDRYGGSFENRSRFLFETMREIRAAVGADFAVGVRLGASQAPGGITEDENKLILKQLEAEGLIDFVDVSRGDYYRMDTMVGTMQNPVGYELPSTADIASVSRLPRIVTGRFRTLEEVEQVLREGSADLVSMVRAQIADPDLVRKTREGRADEVRPCIACNQGCIGGLFRVGRMGCAVNPAVGAEVSQAEDLLQRVSNPKTVLVVGGGPAGMEAARIAAIRGHHVTLAEAQPVLGGTVNIAKLAPTLRTLGDITYWLEQEIYRLGVNIKLSTYMSADDILAAAPDVVIIATGSVPRMDGFQLANPNAPIKGADRKHVISSHDLLLGARSVQRGSTALVFDTVGHYEAIAAVEQLLSLGASVTYVTHAVSMTPYVQTTWRDVPALERFYALGQFEALLRHHLVDIGSDQCIVRPWQAPDGLTRTVAADTVVLVTQNQPLRELYDILRSEGREIFLVGDALAPRDVQVAIAEGHRIARSIA
ncbi:FAD-dependent oxidoreductase [Noviherbaspirillum sedimenti]|uniref:FAD-dependent oxidoreductase n=2 Tax=Noviherbaspirillum sedimenti TaxID=2320865 RepID=A0A3A3GC80_9BURK|nr:FAD-dependent oxidoreductase [Noviherbaspirillum sedimenti]